MCSEHGLYAALDLRATARRLVAEAIKRGDIKKAIFQKCADCGGKAQCYDHRDYRKPLEVDAVCKACDVKRGAGLPFDYLDARWVYRGKESINRIFPEHAENVDVPTRKTVWNNEQFNKKLALNASARKEEIRMLCETMSQTEVGIKLGISRQRVSQLLKS